MKHLIKVKAWTSRDRQTEEGWKGGRIIIRKRTCKPSRLGEKDETRDRDE